MLIGRLPESGRMELPVSELPTGFGVNRKIKRVCVCFTIAEQTQSSRRQTNTDKKFARQTVVAAATAVARSQKWSAIL